MVFLVLLQYNNVKWGFAKGLILFIGGVSMGRVCSGMENVTSATNTLV